MMDADRYTYYERIAVEVETAIEKIRNSGAKKCYGIDDPEKIFIPSLGLNNENLNEQPKEFRMSYGKGLHVWQYPIKLTGYLVWIANNATTIRKYIEIGCRWGGTSILVNEWLKKAGAPLKYSIAVDPIGTTPFIKKYMEISNTPIVYIKNLFASREGTDYIEITRPDMVSVEGDRSPSAVMSDHPIARKWGNIIVHHDVCPQSCPGTTFFWSYLMQGENRFRPCRFYPAVQVRRRNFSRHRRVASQESACRIRRRGRAESSVGGTRDNANPICRDFWGRK